MSERPPNHFIEPQTTLLRFLEAARCGPTDFNAPLFDTFSGFNQSSQRRPLSELAAEGRFDFAD